MTKVAVTGGAGFIGSNLISRLLSQGYDVCFGPLATKTSTEDSC